VVSSQQNPLPASHSDAVDLEPAQNPLDTPHPTVAALVAAQADEFCACATQECVDEVATLYTQRLGDAASSTLDGQALRHATERIAKCDAEHRATWGFGSLVDKRPTTSLN
jgi:hypothetical protein